MGYYLLGVFFAFLISLKINKTNKRKAKTLARLYNQICVKKLDSCFKEGLIVSAECDGNKKEVNISY